jgi:hypothetical protein
MRAKDNKKTLGQRRPSVLKLTQGLGDFWVERHVHELGPFLTWRTQKEGEEDIGL